MPGTVASGLISYNAKEMMRHRQVLEQHQWQRVFEVNPPWLRICTQGWTPPPLRLPSIPPFLHSFISMLRTQRDTPKCHKASLAFQLQSEHTSWTVGKTARAVTFTHWRSLEHWHQPYMHLAQFHCHWWYRRKNLWPWKQCFQDMCTILQISPRKVRNVRHEPIAVPVHQLVGRIVWI